MTVEPKTIPVELEYVGFLQSSHPVEIRSRVEGWMTKLAYVEGSVVKEGDVLYQLDKRPFQAALDSAIGALKRQEAALWDATRSVDRYKPLYEKKAASQRDLDNAIMLQLSSEANVFTAQADVTTAQLNLGYTTIQSPITGLSTLSNFREGALIAAAGQNAVLTTIYLLDPIWVLINISENDLLKFDDQVKKKMIQPPPDKNYKIALILADGSTYPHEGTVNFAAPILDQKTGTMTVRATLSNPELSLRPGQFVRAKVSGAFRPNAIAVPKKALQQGQKGMYVYVVNEEDVVELRVVDPGDWSGDDWIILNGLSKGDVVVVDGVNKIHPGSKVTVKKA